MLSKWSSNQPGVAIIILAPFVNFIDSYHLLEPPIINEDVL